MDNPLVEALIVSGTALLMLSLALAFLCGLMYLMTEYIGEGNASDEQEAGGERRDGAREEQKERKRKQQAAVIAVALARAELELGRIGAPGAEDAVGVSAWWAFHHQRQLTLNAPMRKIR